MCAGKRGVGVVREDINTHRQAVVVRNGNSLALCAMECEGERCVERVMNVC